MLGRICSTLLHHQDERYLLVSSMLMDTSPPESWTAQLLGWAGGDGARAGGGGRGEAEGCAAGSGMKPSSTACCFAGGGGRASGCGGCGLADSSLGRLAAASSASSPGLLS